MGQSKESTMKSFAFVCLFAAAYAAPAADADAEADPALLYSSLGYGFHHPYTYGAYAPYAVPAVHSAAVKSVVETPAEVKTTLSRGMLMPRLMLMLTLPTTILDIATPMPTAASGGSTAVSPIPMVTSGDTTTRVPATAQPFFQQLKCMEIHPCSNFFSFK